MNIQNISLSDIHPYARNPRKNDEAVKNVAASIREFGFLVPLVIDRNHEIVAGHTRYKAAKSLGMKEVPCVIADELTEDQIKAFRLADNKVSEAAQWDMDLLPLELADIVMPMTDFGFDRPMYVFARDGFAPFREEYKAACINLGRHVTFDLPGGELGSGTAIDVDADGQLIVRTDSGEEKVFTGEVSVHGIYGAV